jgi:hypothetical protein
VSGVGSGATGERQQLRLHLRALEQLFNSFDPAPFHERDLDADAEAFLVDWAAELHRRRPLHLVLELEAGAPTARGWVGDAIRHYFDQRANAARQRLHHLLRKGRITLLIGVVFLLGCLLLSHTLSIGGLPEPWRGVLRESLSIGGWVAMWQPLQIYLYDWWPIRDQVLLYRRMAGMTVEVLGHA